MPKDAHSKMDKRLRAIKQAGIQQTGEKLPYTISRKRSKWVSKSAV